MRAAYRKVRSETTRLATPKDSVETETGRSHAKGPVPSDYRNHLLENHVHPSWRFVPNARRRDEDKQAAPRNTVSGALFLGQPPCLKSGGSLLLKQVWLGAAT